MKVTQIHQTNIYNRVGGGGGGGGGGSGGNSGDGGGGNEGDDRGGGSAVPEEAIASEAVREAYGRRRGAAIGGGEVLPLVGSGEGAGGLPWVEARPRDGEPCPTC